MLPMIHRLQLCTDKYGKYRKEEDCELVYTFLGILNAGFKIPETICFVDLLERYSLYFLDFKDSRNAF